MIECEKHGEVKEFNITDGEDIIARVCPHCLVETTLKPRIKIYDESDLV